MTTEQIDVLAVMDRAANQAKGVALDNQGSIVLANHWADITHARAAVAELIAFKAAVEELMADQPLNLLAIRNRAAVLARVQGGAR